MSSLSGLSGEGSVIDCGEKVLSKALGCGLRQSVRWGKASKAMGNCIVRSPEGARNSEVLDFGRQGIGATAGHGAGHEH